MAGGMVDIVTLGPQARMLMEPKSDWFKCRKASTPVESGSKCRHFLQRSRSQLSKLFLNSITCHDLGSNPVWQVKCITLQYEGDPMSEERKRMITDAGRSVGDNQNSLTLGLRGPVVFEDILLFEKMAHFNRERVPVRIVHAKGSGAYGYSGSEVNYEPKTFNGPTEDPAYRVRPRTITGSVDRHNHRLDSDYYTQPGNLFRLMPPGARERLIGNIVASMKSVPQRIQELQVQHFYKADPAYGTGVARGLGLNCSESYSTQSNSAAAHT
jgi:hypothetical protein